MRTDKTHSFATATLIVSGVIFIIFGSLLLSQYFVLGIVTFVLAVGATVIGLMMLDGLGDEK